MDTEALAEGSLLIGVGMAVVFSALVILMVAIMIMNRLFPDRGNKSAEPATLEPVISEESERGKIAALAVALAKAMEKESVVAPRQSAANTVGWMGETSRWAAAGREQVMRARGKAGRQWGRRSD